MSARERDDAAGAALALLALFLIGVAAALAGVGYLALRLLAG